MADTEDLTPTTEREVRIARDSFVIGGSWMYYTPLDQETAGARCIRLEHEAKRRYPLPKGQRPAKRTDSGGWQWRVVDGKIEWSGPKSVQWHALKPDAMFLTLERVHLITELEANPIEEYDSDE